MKKVPFQGRGKKSNGIQVWKRNKSRMKKDLKKNENFRPKMWFQSAAKWRQRMFVGQN